MTIRPPSLTPRERHILKLYAAGRSYADIGETLGISVKTVAARLQQVRVKYRANRRADLIALAVREGLLDTPAAGGLTRQPLENQRPASG